MVYRQTDTFGENMDGTEVDDTVSAAFDIDPDTGLTTGGTGAGTNDQIDSYGNSQEQEFTQDYSIILQDPKVTKQTITGLFDSNKDGSFANLLGDSYTTYTYDKFGRLTAQYGLNQIENDDGFGNTTDSVTESFYVIRGETAQIDHTLTSTESHSNDGSVTTQDKPTETDYTYDKNGVLTGAVSSPSVTTTRDLYGNVDTRTTNVNLEIFVGNQVKSVGITTDGITENADGSTQSSHTVALNRFTSTGALPTGITSTAIESTIADDGYGNLTVGDPTLGQGVFQESQNEDGFSKQAASFSSSVTTMFDGSVIQNQSLVDTYYTDGRMTGGQATHSSSSTDIYNTRTISMGTDSYINVDGLLKLSVQNSTTLSAPVDGSYSLSTTVANYTYSDKRGGVVLSSVDGSGTTESNDGWGNLSYGTVTPTYKIVNGKAVIVQSVSDSTMYMVSGATTRTVMTTYTNYNGVGQAVYQIAKGFSNTNDGYGNLSWEDTIVQQFKFEKGRFAVYDVQSSGGYDNLDFTNGWQTSETIYHLDNELHITDGTTTSRFTGFDSYGNVTESVSISQLAVQATGAAKVVFTETQTDQINLDSSRSITIDDRNTSYSTDGRLAGAISNSTTQSTGPGSTSSSASETIFGVFFGELRQLETQVNYNSMDIFGNSSNGNETTRYYYSYMPDWTQYQFSDAGFDLIGLEGLSSAQLQQLMQSIQNLPPDQQQQYLLTIGGVSGGGQIITAASNTSMAPEVSARFLGEFTGANTFNKDGDTIAPFHTVKDLTIVQSSSLSNGILTQETDGLRTSIPWDNTNLMRAVSFQVNNLAVMNETGWYSQDNTTGFLFASYNWDANARFLNGSSVTVLNVDRLEVPSPFGQETVNGSEVSLSLMQNVDGKQAVVYTQTDSDHIFSMALSETVSTQKTYITYNGVGQAVSSVSYGGSVSRNSSPNSITYSMSETDSYNPYPLLHASLNAYYTETYSQTYGIGMDDGATTSETDSDTIVNRYYDQYGFETGADGMTNSQSSQAFLNSDGTPQGFTWGGSTPIQYSQTVHTYQIFAFVGELSVDDFTTGANYNQDVQTLRGGNGAPIGDIITTNSGGSFGWDFNTTIAYQTAASNEKMLTTSESIEQLAPVLIFNIGNLAIYTNQTVSFDYSGFFLSDVNSSNNASAKIVLGLNGVISTMQQLASKMDGEYLGLGLYYGTLKQFDQQGYIPIDYAKTYLVDDDGTAKVASESWTLKEIMNTKFDNDNTEALNPTEIWGDALAFSEVKNGITYYDGLQSYVNLTFDEDKWSEDWKSVDGAQRGGTIYTFEESKQGGLVMNDQTEGGFSQSNSIETNYYEVLEQFDGYYPKADPGDPPPTPTALITTDLVYSLNGQRWQMPTMEVDLVEDYPAWFINPALQAYVIEPDMVGREKGTGVYPWMTDERGADFVVQPRDRGGRGQPGGGFASVDVVGPGDKPSGESDVEATGG